MGCTEIYYQCILMREKFNLDTNSLLLLIFGALLLFWGISGTIGTFRSGIADGDNDVVVDEGFLPYSVPLEDENRDEDANLQMGPPDQTVEVLDESFVVVSEGVVESENSSEIDIVESQEKVIVPGRIVIPKIELIAPIGEAGLKKTWMEAKQYEQWLAPDEFAVGWHFTSARLGEVGNTVLNGHHNVHGKVFVDLEKLEPGDLISVYGEGNEFRYVVVNKMILPERKVSAEERLENARWIMPSADERLTLVTCWPYESNTHRLVIVAKPYVEQ